MRLIKNYEQQRVDMATGAIQSLKKKHQDNIDFSSDYEKYYPILRKFIKSIDVKSVSKSNKLTFSTPADIEGNGLYDDTGGMESEEIDNIAIHFNHTDKALYIIIKDNHLEEDEYDSWTVKETINFKFEIKDNLTVDFAHAVGEYN